MQALSYESIARERPTHVRYRVMFFLCVLSFLTYYDRFCITRAQDDIQHDLKITDPQMAWIFGMFWFAYAVFEIPIGWWGDRFGARRTLTRIVLAWSLFTALSGSAVGFWSLLTYRFLFGLGEAGAYPNMARIQSRWLNVRARARAGGLLWLTARWGGAFSPIIYGWLLRGFSSQRFREFLAGHSLLEPLAHVASWRLGFWASGLLGVIWVVLFYPFFRDDPAEKASVNRAELDVIAEGRVAPVAHTGPGDMRAVMLRLLRSPGLWAFALLYFCGSFGWSFFASWMPRYFKDIHHVPFQKSELMNAAPLFFGGLSCLAGGWLSDLLVKWTGWKRLGRAIFPVCGMITAACAIFSIRFAQTPWQAVALMCLANAAQDFGQGANWASIVDMGGGYAGTSLGFINLVGNMANFLQPVIGQWVFHHLGWNALFAVYAGAFLVAACMWLFIDPRRRFYEEAPDKRASSC